MPGRKAKGRRSSERRQPGCRKGVTVTLEETWPSGGMGDLASIETMTRQPMGSVPGGRQAGAIPMDVALAGSDPFFGRVLKRHEAAGPTNRSSRQAAGGPHESGCLLVSEAMCLESRRMKNLALKVQKFLKSEDGPTAVEYAVMLALIVVVCLASIQAIGTRANQTFNSVANQLGSTTAS